MSETVMNRVEQQHSLGMLMERYIGGDEGAFQELHQFLSPRIRRQIRGKISDRYMVEDLVQVTFLKAHIARERFASERDSNPDRAVAVWYASIARNATIDHLRRQYKERNTQNDSGTEGIGDVIAHLCDPDPNTETAAIQIQERAELRARMRATLDQLPKNQREVIELHKFQGLSMSEISERMQIRPGTLRVRAHRAYQALAQLWRGVSPAVAHTN